MVGSPPDEGAGRLEDAIPEPEGLGKNLPVHPAEVGAKINVQQNQG